MKIIVNTTKEGEVSDVRNFTYYQDKFRKTDQEIIDATKKSNEQADYERFKIIDVPDNLLEVIKFLLGDDQYKTTHKLDEIYHCLEDIETTISRMQGDLYDTCNWIEDTAKKIKEVADTKNG